MTLSVSTILALGGNASEASNSGIKQLLHQLEDRKFLKVAKLVRKLLLDSIQGT